jgi:VPDSG-CTERM motif
MSVILYTLMSIFLATSCRYLLQLLIFEVHVKFRKGAACLVLFQSSMKSSSKLLLILAAATAVFLVQPAKADQIALGGPTIANVPDSGSTISLLGFALLGTAALRRKLSR